MICMQVSFPTYLGGNYTQEMQKYLFMSAPERRKLSQMIMEMREMQGERGITGSVGWKSNKRNC
jgi:hypothetical protein